MQEEDEEEEEKDDEEKEEEVDERGEEEIKQDEAKAKHDAGEPCWPACLTAVCQWTYLGAAAGSSPC
jgi:hypothetical protein